MALATSGILLDKNILALDELIAYTLENLLSAHAVRCHVSQRWRTTYKKSEQ